MADDQVSSGQQLPLRPRPSEVDLPSPIRQRSPSRSTPRRSTSKPPNNNGAVVSQQTPNISRASATPSSLTRFSIRTPGNQALDFRSSRQLLSASGRRGAGGAGAGGAVPTQFTPHGRAAIRALDSRRAAINEINTPGRNRRRSIRDQRETPRDLLRALSRTLAPKSEVITTSSSSSPDDPNNNNGHRRDGRSRSRGQSRRGGPLAIPEDPDDSDEFPIDRPRLSLPIGDEDDSDDDIRPPRTSGLEDLEDNFTMQSIEMARRQTLDNQQGFSMRMSDYGPMNEPPSDEDIGIDSAFFPRANWDDNAHDDTGMGGPGDDDATFERIEDDDTARRETLGRESFGAIDVNFDEADQSTVMLPPQVESSPRRETLSSSPPNEPFDQENDPLPEEMEVDVDNEPLDSGAQFEGEEGIGNNTEISDLGSEEATAALLERRTKPAAVKQFKKPGKKISQHGIDYPSLPAGVVKRVAQRFAGKSKISPDTLAALMQASDWFFEQLGDDLSAYAKHAKRKTIDESDMLTLMRRQRQINATTTPFALAQRHLPRELLQELRILGPARAKAKKRGKIPQDGENGSIT